MLETWILPLGWENPLEKGKVTHSSILTYRIPWIIQGVANRSDTTEQLSLSFLRFLAQLPKIRKSTDLHLSLPSWAFSQGWHDQRAHLITFLSARDHCSLYLRAMSWKWSFPNVSRVLAVSDWKVDFIFLFITWPEVKSMCLLNYIYICLYGFFTYSVLKLEFKFMSLIYLHSSLLLIYVNVSPTLIYFCLVSF